MRWLRRALLFLVLLPGGLLLLVAALVAASLERIKALGYAPPFAVLLWSRVWTSVLFVEWPLHVGVLAQERSSTPRDGSYPLGDVGDPRGPAVGAGQVLASNVTRLRASSLLWRLLLPADATRLALVGQERGAMLASVLILRESLRAAGGDKYNGAQHYNGNNVASQLYADSVIRFYHLMRGEPIDPPASALPLPELPALGGDGFAGGGGESGGAGAER